MLGPKARIGEESGQGQVGLQFWVRWPVWDIMTYKVETRSRAGSQESPRGWGMTTLATKGREAENHLYSSILSPSSPAAGGPEGLFLRAVVTGLVENQEQEAGLVARACQTAQVQIPALRVFAVSPWTCHLRTQSFHLAGKCGYRAPCLAQRRIPTKASSFLLPFLIEGFSGTVVGHVS